MWLGSALRFVKDGWSSPRLFTHNFLSQLRSRLLQVEGARLGPCRSWKCRLGSQACIKHVWLLYKTLNTLIGKSD